MRNQLAFAMKGLFIAIQILLFVAARANTYYFSSSEGNDSRTNQEAQQASTPWQSLAKLNSFFSNLHAGDSILFKRDDIFFGSVQVSISGIATDPIVLAAYGSGKQPVLTGFTVLTNWAAASNDIWEASLTPGANMIRSVLVNGSPQAIGRYPNTTEPNGGYLRIQNVPDAHTITGSLLPAAGSWTGAEVVIRKNHWVLDRNAVTGISGATVQYNSESGYGATVDYGYFIQNNPATLDQPFEWYCIAGSHTLGMYFGRQGPAGTVTEVSTVDQLVTIDQQNNIVFDGLVFKGANENAVNINQGSYIQIKNCSILYSGNTAVHATQCQHLLIENTNIDYSNNIACDISNSSNLQLKNNSIAHTGTVAGSGKGDSGSYEALLLSGDDQLIEGNTILNTGYIPVTFNGNRLLIRNNFISSFGFIKDDGGGIYGWNNASNAPVHTARTIDGNIILDGLGAPDGTADKKKWIHGIYMDDNTDHVSITNNTTANCGQYGVFIHNAHDLILDGNTSFNNQEQIALIHDNIAPQIPVSNITLNNNIFFSKSATQPVAHFETIDPDLSGMGSFDYNFYCRPLDEQSPLTASWKTGWGLYDVKAWQQFQNKDLHSQKTAVSIVPYRINSVSFNLYANSSFSSNINGLYVFSSAGNATANWSSTSPLNGGALKISFSNLAGNANHVSVIIGIGSVTAGHTYLLRYDAAGAGNRYIESYLRKSLSPYNDLSSRNLSRAYDARSACEVLFTATATESNASIGIDIPEQAAPVYLDNLQLNEVQATITNPDDSIRFLYNKTAATTSSALDGDYTDARGINYSGNVSLPPFSSAVLIKRSLVLLPVRFSSFDAIKNTNSVLLQWVLADTGPGETQQIERSADGRSFKKIGEQQALASAGTGHYSFTDGRPLKDNYYRIRYISQGGAVVYSKTVQVHFAVTPTTMAERLQISPNPATDQLQVLIDSSSCHPCRMILQTATGSTLRSILLESTSTTLDVSALTRGIYVISIITETGLLSKRFAKS